MPDDELELLELELEDDEDELLELDELELLEDEELLDEEFPVVPFPPPQAVTNARVVRTAKNFAALYFIVVNLLLSVLSTCYWWTGAAILKKSHL